MASSLAEEIDRIEKEAAIRRREEFEAGPGKYLNKAIDTATQTHEESKIKSDRQVAQEAQMNESVDRTNALRKRIGEIKPSLISNNNRMNAAQIQGGQRSGGEAQVLEALRARAMGQGPSMADMQAQRERERSTAQQMSMAAGGSPLALRNAQQQAAMASQGIAADASMARVAEQDQARRTALGAYQSGRAQDIDLAKSQAGLEQQAALSNQSVDLKTALANQSVEDAMSKFKIGAEGTVLSQRYGMNRDQWLDEQARQQAITSAGMNVANAYTGAAGLNLGYSQGLDQLQAQQSAQNANRNANMWGSAMGAVATVGAGAMMAASEKRTKEKMTSPKKMNRQLLSALKRSKEYNYKEGYNQDTSKRHIGPMADDLPESMIIKKDGIKHIDITRLATGLGSVVGEQQEEIDKLKRALKKKSS